MLKDGIVCPASATSLLQLRGVDTPRKATRKPVAHVLKVNIWEIKLPDSICYSIIADDFESTARNDCKYILSAPSQQILTVLLRNRNRNAV